MQEEARRLHLSNNEMAVSLKSSSQAAASADALRREVRAYQEINDRLEAAKAAAEARHASMRDALALMSHRAALLQQQLVLSHAQQGSALALALTRTLTLTRRRLHRADLRDRARLLLPRL